jgi:alkanesulfonate monooxygenase SsuD/methylene tetrahydromethanopterin reductase-like flavin-dependent oxidoreductase (luciferase family)
MCELAGEVADSVLLNWITPEHARTSLELIATGAQRAGRNRPPVATYVRCAIGPDSSNRLEAECARYGSFPHYAAHFRRQGVQPIDTTLHSNEVSKVQRGLAGLESILDEVVVRAITPHDAMNEVLELIQQTQPA